MLAEPWLLRAMLFVGLAAHKVLWEWLKRSEAVQLPPRRAPSSAGIAIVKGVKIVVLGFLLIQTLFLDVLPVTTRPGLLRAVGTAIFTIGLVIAMTARLQLGRNWSNLEDHAIGPEQALVSNGLYRYVRHPIYTGDLLLLIGLELALNSWLVLAVVPVIAVIVRQVIAEEHVLKRALPHYDEYSARTKRFIPLIV